MFASALILRDEACLTSTRLSQGVLSHASHGQSITASCLSLFCCPLHRVAAIRGPSFSASCFLPYSYNPLLYPVYYDLLLRFFFTYSCVSKYILIYTYILLLLYLEGPEQLLVVTKGWARGDGRLLSKCRLGLDTGSPLSATRQTGASYLGY